MRVTAAHHSLKEMEMWLAYQDPREKGENQVCQDRLKMENRVNLDHQVSRDHRDSKEVRVKPDLQVLAFQDRRVSRDLEVFLELLVLKDNKDRRGQWDPEVRGVQREK